MNGLVQNKTEFHKLIWFVTCLLLLLLLECYQYCSVETLCMLSMLVFMRLAVKCNFSDTETAIQVE